MPTSRGTKRLPGALERHRAGGQLKDAFDSVNCRRDTRDYDRTALTGWLSGRTPSNRNFIVKLAEELGDPEVLAAFEHDLGVDDRELNDLVTRFRSLATERKRAVLPELITELFADDVNNRTKFWMRVQLHPGLTEVCHRLDVSMGWVGHLPPRATVDVAAEEDLLHHAYTQERCIFRELVPLDGESFEKATQALGSRIPVLRFKPAADPAFAKADLAASPEGSEATYEFDNDEVASAEIRLDLCLPYPADLPMYAVMLGAYSVAGRAEITMVTDGDTCGRPHVLQFLGHTPAWAHPAGFRSELRLEIGDEKSLVEPNSGVIFFWRSHDRTKPR